MRNKLYLGWSRFADITMAEPWSVVHSDKEILGGTPVFVGTRVPLGRYRADPDLWALVEASIEETAAVGRAEGVGLKPDAVERGLAMIRSMPDHHMTSMGNDLLRGNRLELPWFAGKVVELGRRHGIATPVNSFVYAALKLHANGAV